MRALGFLALAAAAAMAVPASAAVVVTTANGTGADAEIRESAVAGNAGSNRGLAADLNTRFVSGANDELFLLRFDLASMGVTAADITAATFDITPTRTNSNNNGLNVYGLNPAAANQDWIESGAGAVNFSNFSGVINDNDLTTRGVNLSNLTLLGQLTWTTAPAAGVTINMSTPAMTAFLQNAGPTVTFVLDQVIFGTGQLRFVSKESSALGNTTNPDTGTPKLGLEPRLTLDVVPEPTSLSILAIGGLAAIRRRR